MKYGSNIAFKYCYGTMLADSDIMIWIQLTYQHEIKLDSYMVLNTYWYISCELGHGTNMNSMGKSRLRF